MCVIACAYPQFSTDRDHSIVSTHNLLVLHSSRRRAIYRLGISHRIAETNHATYRHTLGQHVLLIRFGGFMPADIRDQQHSYDRNMLRVLFHQLLDAISVYFPSPKDVRKGAM
jgi:hypothetical protein